MKRSYVTLDQGQKLGYRIYGNGSRTILFFHGLLGGSLFGDDWVAAIAQSDTRLIVLERPGYGISSQIKLENPAQWQPLIQKAALELELQKAQVVGCSAGAPYAYATALALPRIIKKVWILGGVPAVYDTTVLKHYTPDNQAAYKGFIENSSEAVQGYYTAQMSAVLEQSKAANREEYIIKALEEAVAQNCFGMAQESRLQMLPWDLDFSAVGQPVVIGHARKDEMVPFEAACEMPSRFNNCRFEVLEAPGLKETDSVHMGSISHGFLTILSGKQ